MSEKLRITTQETYSVIIKFGSLKYGQWLTIVMSVLLWFVLNIFGLSTRVVGFRLNFFFIPASREIHRNWDNRWERWRWWWWGGGERIL